jgi:uncharacterized protein YfaP (DUF2135 family)
VTGDFEQSAASMSITSNHDECRYNLQRLCPAETVYAGAGCQEFCPMMAAAAHQTYEFCSSDDDCPSSSGGRSIPSTLRLESRDALTHAELTSVSYRIYSHFGRNWNGCSGTDCGILVTTKDTVPSGTVALVPGGREYLIVASKEGYYSTWSRSFVDYAGHASSVDLGGSYTSISIMTQTLQSNQQRFVLRWAHAGDLDLWVVNNSNPDHSVSYSSPSGSFGQGTVTMDHDSFSGSEGPESTLVQSVSPGVLSVWVHANEFDFSFDVVRYSPASVDVYCNGCSTGEQQTTRIGWVSTVTQRTRFLPVPNVRWWRAGDLVTRDDGTVHWEPCPSYCFGTAPVSSAKISLTSMNLPTSLLLAGPISYTVYRGHSDVDACRASGGQDESCGSAVGECSVASGVIDACNVVLPSNSLYLLVTEAAGFLISLQEIYLGMRAASVVADMVPSLQPDQNRVVLQWGHTGDMDVWLIESLNTGNRVGWTRRSANFGFGDISLDRDVRAGPGTETLQLTGQLDRTVEIWVNHYGGASNVAKVTNYPSSVDIYCHECSFLNDVGVLVSRTGFVTTVTQDAEDISTATYRWWKVGEFVPDSQAAGSIRWQRCSSGCYRDSAYIYQPASTRAHPGLESPDKTPVSQSLESLIGAKIWRKMRRARASLQSELSESGSSASAPSSNARKLHSAPFMPSWANPADGHTGPWDYEQDFSNTNNTAFFEAYDSMGDYRAYWSRFCCSMVAAIRQTMAAGCNVTSSEISQRVAHFLRFESDGVCEHVDCPGSLMEASGDREVMAMVPHVEALRRALAAALGLPAVSYHHILIVEVCEHWGCAGFLGHNHSDAHSMAYGHVHPDMPSDTVQVKFQVMAQTPAQSQLAPAIDLELEVLKRAMMREGFARMVETGMAHQGIAVGSVALHSVELERCAQCSLPLTWSLLRQKELHARSLCSQGDPDYAHACAGSVFLSGGMGCGYVPDVHEVWVCVDPRLTLGECGPARHQLAEWQAAAPRHQACFTFHESTHQFEYLGDNLSLNLTGHI